MTEREASREKFEAWALSELKQDAARWRNHEGYVYLQSEWLAWQASRQQALEEAAKEIEVWRDDYPPRDKLHIIYDVLAGAIRSLSHPTGGK